MIITRDGGRISKRCKPKENEEPNFSKMTIAPIKKLTNTINEQ